MNLPTEARWHAHDVVKDEANAAVPSMEQIRDLALRQPGTPVLSVYVRTDPRDWNGRSGSSDPSLPEQSGLRGPRLLPSSESGPLWALTSHA